jgi:hypothetical protein
MAVVIAHLLIRSPARQAGRAEERITKDASRRPYGHPGRAIRYVKYDLRTGALSGGRAAQMIGELVPLLTSPGDLNDKLRLVSQRLCLGAGYAAVNIEVFGPAGPAAHSSFRPGQSSTCLAGTSSSAAVASPICGS